MSLMGATLLAFGRLSSDMEVTACKSSGIHLFRLMLPALAFGALMTAAMLYFNDKVLPAAHFTFKQVHFRILQKQANIAIKERVFIDKFEGYHFYIDQKDRNGVFSNVKAFNRFSQKASVQTTIAKTGELETNQSNYQVFFHMNDGVMTWDNGDFNTYNRLYFQRYDVRLKLDSQLSHIADLKKDYEDMDLGEISREIERTNDTDRKRSLQNEFQKRISLPFAGIVLIWFCAPLGLWTRSKGFIGFVLGIAMIFIYYLMFTLGQILSEKGSVHPIVGLWWANVALTLAGGFIYYLVVTEHAALKRFPGFGGKKTV
jgi:lipopolysaccharide export system permease protein